MHQASWCKLKIWASRALIDNRDERCSAHLRGRQSQPLLIQQGGLPQTKTLQIRNSGVINPDHPGFIIFVNLDHKRQRFAIHSSNSRHNTVLDINSDHNVIQDLLVYQDHILVRNAHNRAALDACGRVDYDVVIHNNPGRSGLLFG